MHSKQKYPMSRSTSNHLRSRDSFRKEGVLIDAPFTIKGKTVLTLWLLQPNSKSSWGDKDMNTVLALYLPSVHDTAQQEDSLEYTAFSQSFGYRRSDCKRFQWGSPPTHYHFVKRSDQKTFSYSRTK